MKPGLTKFLRENRSRGTFGAALGLFDPTGLSLALNWADEPDASYESRIAAMGALLHERTHWLQFVGTSAGQFSAWLGALQGGLMFDSTWREDPLERQDLPLLDNDRVSEARKLLWLACERLFISVFGAPRPYIDRIFDEGGFQREAMSEQLRVLTSTVLGPHPAYEEAQDRIEAAEQGEPGEVRLIDDHGFAFGALHCMEGMARTNELFKLHDGIEAMNKGWGLDADPYWFPPYSNARDLYFHVTERNPGDNRDEVAVCVLADWALNCLLPPLIPLKVAFGENPILPGPLFAFLARHLDVEAIPDQPEDTRVTWSEGFTHGIYAQIEERTEGRFPNPLEVAKFRLSLMPELESQPIPESIYSPATPERDVQPQDEAARLRFLAILGAKAARTRLDHPAFFPLPHSYYSLDLKFFHQLWDPIEPPLLTLGPRRHLPTRDDPDWFKFFYLSAIQHQLGMDVAYHDCPSIGSRLASYRGTPLDPDSEEHLLRAAVIGLLGEGSAAEQILEESRLRD